jgi:2'-5' RNA ligase
MLAPIHPGADHVLMRCFVALALPPPLRKLLVQVQDALRRADADVKWVEEDNLHLSLKFLGDVDEEPLAKLKGILSVEALRWPAMGLDYSGVGAFPDHGAPRVVWAGCGGELEKLAGLAAAIERSAEQVGVPRERHPFVAHLTIGRVRSDRNLKRLQSAIENQREVPLGRDEVRGFVLFKSTLTPKGPVYEALATFPLKRG